MVGDAPSNHGFERQAWFFKNGFEGGGIKVASFPCRFFIWNGMLEKMHFSGFEINSCVIPNSLEDLGEFLAICPGTLGNLIRHLPRNLPGTSSAICTGTLWNLISYLHRNPPKPHQPSAPEPSGTLSTICTGIRNLISHLHRNPPEPHQQSAPELREAICTGTLQNLINHLPRNPPEPHQPFAPEPSGTSSAICTGTLQNLISNLHQNFGKPSAPEPSGTSSAICTGTLQNLISNLHQNSGKPSAPEPSGTSSAICPGTLRNLISTRTLRNLISYLPRNSPEPHQLHPSPSEPHQPSAPEGSGTLRNLVLQLHRITPEPFWAKDPIASFAVGEKKQFKIAMNQPSKNYNNKCAKNCKTLGVETSKTPKEYRRAKVHWQITVSKNHAV